MLAIPRCIFSHSDSTVVKGQCLVSSVCWQGEQEHVLSAVMTGVRRRSTSWFLALRLDLSGCCTFFMSLT